MKKTREQLKAAKEARKEYHLNYQRTHRDKTTSYWMNWYRNNKDKWNEYVREYRAKKKRKAAKAKAK